MRFSYFPLYVALLFVKATLQAAPPPLSIGEMMNVIHIEDAQISPDGRTIAFVRANADFKSNIYRLSLWELDVSSGKSQEVSTGPFVGEPCWSRDGRLAFFEKSVGKTVLCIQNSRFGNVDQRADVPRKAHSLTWSPNGEALCFLAPDQVLEAEASKRVVDTRVASLDLDRSQLFSIDAKLEKYRQISHEPGHVVHFDWSPNSSAIVFAAQPTSQANDEGKTDLFVLDVSTKKVAPLLTRPGSDSCPRWSPDGNQIAFISQNGKEGWLSPMILCVMPAQGGKAEILSAGPDDYFQTRSKDCLTWAPDGSGLYFPVIRGVTRHLFRIDLGDRSLKWVTKEEGGHRHFSISRDCNRMAYVLSQPSTPGDLYISTLSAFHPTRVLDMNPQLKESSLGVMSVVRWKSKDGSDIEGILVQPAQRKTEGRIPLITCLHGGPVGGFLMQFSPETMTAPQVGFCPVHVLAGRGFAVFCPNPRGSFGYGAPFREAVIKNWGECDLQDVLSGIDHLIEQGIADPKRLAVTGYCYGGYLSLRALTRTDRFRAACLGAAFGDLVAVYGQTDIPDLFEGYFGGPPWKNLALYTKASPLHDAHNIRTPTLLFHAEKDQRIPWTQSRQLYTLLKRVSTPVDLISYPRGGHTVFEPRMNAETMKQSVLWYEKWLTEK